MVRGEGGGERAEGSTYQSVGVIRVKATSNQSGQVERTLQETKGQLIVLGLLVEETQLTLHKETE